MKRSAGRPRLKENEDTVRFETRVPLSLEQALTRAADEAGVTKAEITRLALMKHLNLIEV